MAVSITEAEAGSQDRSGLLKTVLEVLLYAIAMGVLLWWSRGNHYHIDEQGFLKEGKAIAELLLARDFDPEKWHGRSSEYGELNPNLGKLIVGIPAVVADVQLPNVSYDWKMSLDANVLAGAFPDRKTILQLRLPVMMFAVVTLALAWHILLRLTGNAVVAFAGALAILSVQSFLYISAYVLMDIFYLCALLAFVLHGFLLQRIERASRLHLWGMIAGLITGAATSSKVIGLVVLAPVALILLGIWCWERKQRVRNGVLAAVLYFLSAVALTYALNPQWWINFGTIDSAELAQEWQTIRKEGLEWEAYIGPRYKDRAPVAGKYPQLSNLARPLDYFVSFPRYKILSREQAVSRPGYGEHRTFEVARDLFWSSNGYWISPFVFPLMLIGLVTASVKLSRSFLLGTVLYPELVLLTMAAVVWCFLMVTMPFPSPRYFMPGKALIILFAAYGLHGAWKWIYRKMSQSGENAAHSPTLLAV